MPRRDESHPEEVRPSNRRSRGTTSTGDPQAQPSGGRRVRKTSETVALQVVEDIVARDLSTGARLPHEAAMLAQYAVSRASLREALRLLEVQGLIRLKPGPGGGPVVGTVDPANLARTAALYFHLGGMTYGELLDTQCALEPLCAQLAATHGDRDAMRVEFAPFMDPAAEGRPDYPTEASHFHGIIYAHTGNRILTLLTRSITYTVTSHVVDTLHASRPQGDVDREHRSIAGAILAGQGSKAHRLTAEHFSALRDWVRAGWPAKLDRLVEWR